MLTKFALAIAGTALAGSALAADLPSGKAPPVAYAPPAPVFSWSGFYVGVNAGDIFAIQTDYHERVLRDFQATAPRSFRGWVSVADLSHADRPRRELVSTNNFGINRDRFHRRRPDRLQLAVLAAAFVMAGRRRLPRHRDQATSPPLTVVPVLPALAPAFPVTEVGTYKPPHARVTSWAPFADGSASQLTPELPALWNRRRSRSAQCSHAAVSFIARRIVPDPERVCRNCSPGISSRSTTRVGWTRLAVARMDVCAKLEPRRPNLSTTISDASNEQVAPLTIGPHWDGGTLGSALVRISTRFNGRIARAGLNYHFSWGELRLRLLHGTDRKRSSGPPN